MSERLYIVDKNTGDKVLLAKDFGDGYRLWAGDRPFGSKGNYDHIEEFLSKQNAGQDLFLEKG